MSTPDILYEVCMGQLDIHHNLHHEHDQTGPDSDNLGAGHSDIW